MQNSALIELVECKYLKMCVFIYLFIFLKSNINILEHIGRFARMSVLDTDVDGSNPGSSMFSP